MEVVSAGSKPADEVDPNALWVLGVHGIPVEDPRPKRTEQVLGLGWDVVITVCDRARDTCPVLPGATLAVHWGMADPAGAPDEGRAFEEAFQTLSGRIDRLLALPLDTLSPSELREELGRIGSEALVEAQASGEDPDRASESP